MIESMKQALEALGPNAPECCGCRAEWQIAITSLRQAIAELESQEPVAWMYDDDYQRMLTSETFCKVWSLEVGSAERGLTNIRLYTHPPQRTEQNFCPRCGKRTNDIHTCTPPRNIEQEGKQMIDWYSVEGETRSYGVGMVACVYAIGRDEVVHVVTHESVKDIAMQHLPIQRTWVGLTDEEVKHEWEVWRANVPRYAGFAKGIEAKLKEKNT